MTTQIVLEMQNVNKTFPHPTADVEVLKDLDFQLFRGESVAILGPSGSGKSTFLSLLAGLDKPTSGSVLLDGKDIVAMNEKDLTQYRSQKIGIVFQQFHLIQSLTALENVALPADLRGIDAREMAKKALAEVGLSHREDHFPHQLSGGECQRVAIARALILEPPIILADEPTGNLDPQTGETIMRLLFAAAKSRKMSLVLVTHNLPLATRCDRQMLLGNQTF